jgi:hypothetical protein
MQYHLFSSSCSFCLKSNHAVILYNNAMMSHNILEAARQNGVQRFFYASSACVYPESKLVRVVLPVHAECLFLVLFSLPARRSWPRKRRTLGLRSRKMPMDSRNSYAAESATLAHLAHTGFRRARHALRARFQNADAHRSTVQHLRAKRKRVTTCCVPFPAYACQFLCSKGTWKGGREKAPAAICRKVDLRRLLTCLLHATCAPIAGCGCWFWL